MAVPTEQLTAAEWARALRAARRVLAPELNELRAAAAEEGLPEERGDMGGQVLTAADVRGPTIPPCGKAAR